MSRLDPSTQAVIHALLDGLAAKDYMDPDGSMSPVHLALDDIAKIAERDGLGPVVGGTYVLADTLLVLLTNVGEAERLAMLQVIRDQYFPEPPPMTLVP